MTIVVRRFQADDAPALERLNHRLAAAGLPHRVDCDDLLGDEPSLDNQPIITRLYVAANGQEIHGGVWLREQLFWSEGGPIRIGWVKYPVAESLVNRAAAGVPTSLLFTLLRQQPHLMALGMGGYEGPLARLLAAARWKGSAIPFFFRLLQPSRVLRQLSYARTTPVRRMIADVLANSGLGAIGYKLVAGAHAFVRARPPGGYTSTVVDTFGTWADEFWLRSRDAYGFIAVRDSRVLNALYPEGLACLTRLRVQHGGRDAGWICARSIDAAGTWFERTFGNLRLGILTDALALPMEATAVMEAGCRYLAEQGVDLIVTFQSHPAWCAAATSNGLLPGPSNCAFYRPPSIEHLITSAAAKNRHFYLTYSDGDGPEVVQSRPHDGALSSTGASNVVSTLA